MTTLYFLCLIIGGIGGGVAGHKITKYKSEKNAPPVIVATPEPDEISKELTNVDLLQTPCSVEFISKYSDGLCREMFCLMNIRGQGSETSGSQCEEISNVNNSITMLKYCTPEIPENATEDDIEKINKFREECLRTFRERK